MEWVLLRLLIGVWVRSYLSEHAWLKDITKAHPPREWWPIKSRAVQWTVFSRQLALCESHQTAGLVSDFQVAWFLRDCLSKVFTTYINLGVKGLNESVQFQGPPEAFELFASPERLFHLSLEHSVSLGAFPWKWKVLSLEEIVMHQV